MISTPATTSERPVKTLLRNPQIDPRRRTTFILASLAALLSVAVVIVVAVRYF
jgi:hypothetical protein